MPDEGQAFRTYSTEELRLLAAEGRLKGRGVQALLNGGHSTAADRRIGRAAFDAWVRGLPGWSAPQGLVDTFIELATIPSPSGEEGTVATYLQEKLRLLDFNDCQLDEVGNLTGILPSTAQDSPNLLFTAHMDCVYPGGAQAVTPEFLRSGQIRTDRANSLGADDKAGIAAILATLGYVRNAKIAHGEIRVLFTVQEELGFRGIKRVPASILNGIHLVVSMDPPVRVERGETAHIAVLHMPPDHALVPMVRAAAEDCGIQGQVLFAEDGYVGGDTICLSPLGALVVDFCSCSRYPHTANEHLCADELVHQANWMMATVERVLGCTPDHFDLRAVYGDVPIGELTGVRKQIPITPELVEQKVELANGLSHETGPSSVPALSHLSAMAPRVGDPALLRAVVDAYGRCLRLDQVPQVLRGLTTSLVHLASNLADVRFLEPLIPTVQSLVEPGSDDPSRLNGLRFLEELFEKERRVAVKARVLRILTLCLQSSSSAVVSSARDFLRANLDETIHALTVAFCSRDRAGWERSVVPGTARIVNGRKTIRDRGARWTLIRQRILQLLLEEDRILPEMLEWIFAHDGAATQRIAVGYIDPEHGSRIAQRILQNLKSRQPGIQETAVHFVGANRMQQAVEPLIELLLTPYECRNRSLVEWALDAIGPPALDPVIARLGDEPEYARLVKGMFNRHDRTTDADFQGLEGRLEETYGNGFRLDDPSQSVMIGHYIGQPDLRSTRDVNRWDKRRIIIFYDRLLNLYPSAQEMEKLAEILAEAEEKARPHFIRMAAQRNVFDDPEFVSLVAHENPRFLSHFVRLERQMGRRALLGRLREFMAGAQVDMSDSADVERYYLYLLKQSDKMPDRIRYLKHMEQARTHTFPQLRPYCRAFTIAGDRIEEVGTVDRRRVRDLIGELPRPDGRAERLERLLTSDAVARRERQRLVTGLAETLGVDVSRCNSLEERARAVMDAIDFEFDAAYRPVPQVVYPHLLRVRMKHRSDAVVADMASYALEFALIDHPEIVEILDSGELDLVLDNLNDLLTDRVYEAERDLSDDVFEELRSKHVQSLAQFYTAQWRYVVNRLKRHFPKGRQSDLIQKTEQVMSSYNVHEEDGADLLDTNLNRLVQVLRPDDPELFAFHLRHRECYKVHSAVLRVRSVRQLKRIYREVCGLLQDEISFANREEAKALRAGSGGTEGTRTPVAPGYLKYARKELGKLNKLMSDFVLEKGLAARVATVQSEITKLRQVVVGTSQILCVPSKDVSIIYRSWPGNDCNTGDIRQVLSPDCSFYKIISDGDWKGYFTLVEVQKRAERALLLDVLNYSGLRMENESFVKVLMHHIIQTAQAEGMRYVLTSSYENHLSNRDYIRRSLRRTFPPLGTVQGFGLINAPTAAFQSLVANLSVIWESGTAG